MNSARTSVLALRAEIELDESSGNVRRGCIKTDQRMTFKGWERFVTVKEEKDTYGGVF